MSEFYELTVAIWDRAIAAGMEPVEGHGFENGEQYYKPRNFHFRHPPTREDWWELCRRTPWMEYYEKQRPLIGANPWPLVQPMHKAAHVELTDQEGRHTGRLCVDLIRCVDNAFHNIPFVGSEAQNRLTRGLREPARQAACMWLYTHENQIAEEVMRRAKGQPADSNLVAKVAKQLFQRERGKTPCTSAATADTTA